MPIWAWRMTETPRRHSAATPSMSCRYWAVALVMLAGTAHAGMADRLAGYIDGCRTALLTGDVVAFDDLEVETQTVTDTVSILGWRDGQEGGLTVSLLRRGETSGVCDIAYRPLGPTSEELTELAEMAERMAVQEMEKHPSKVEMAQAGQVILTCAGDRGMALFLDPTAKGQGFAAQVATVAQNRMRCGG